MNILLIIFLFLTGALCFKFGAGIPFKEQWPLYESLRNTSAIIFGVMGAWIAIIYPNVLSKIYGRVNSSDAKAEAEKINKLISPMLYATTIVAIVLVIGLAAPIAKRIEYLSQYHNILRSLSFSIFGMLTIAQLWSLILTLIPNDIILRKLNRFISRREKLSKKFKTLKQKKP